MAKAAQKARTVKTSKSTSPDARWISGVASVGLVAFMLVVAIPELPGSVAGGFPFRGIATGVAVGLLADRSKAAWGAACAAVAALVGGIVLLTIPTLMVPAGAILLPALLAAGVAWLVAYVLPVGPVWARPLVAGLVIAVIYGWSTGVVPGPQASAYTNQRAQLARTPGPEEYGFDGWIYLKTVSYLKEGKPHYEAFQRAWTEDSRLDGQIASPMGFREPLLFQLWRMAPGYSVGQQVHGLFLVTGLVAALLAWWTLRPLVDEGVAMLAGLGVIPIFAFAGLVGLWFTMSEIWAAVAVLGALSLLIRKQYLWSAVLLLTAVAIREIAVIFVPAWAVAWWLCETKQRWAAGLAIAGPAAGAVVFVHWLTAPAVGGVGAGIGAWMQSTGIQRLVEAIAFGGSLPGTRVMTTMAMVLAVLGCALVKDSWHRWTLLTALVVPLVFLTSFSSGPWDYYWGMLVSPVVMAFMPLVFVRLFPSALSDA